MLPVLLDLKLFKIYTEGVFLVLAFFWGSFFLWKIFLLTSYKEEDIFDGLFVSLLSAFLVGRFVYVIFHFDMFGFDILKFILVNGYPGIDTFGFLIGGFLTFYFFSLSRKMKFAKVIDYTVAPVMLTVAISKIGSFFSGSEVGTKTRFFLALRYPNYDGARHLTAFYEGVLLFLGAYLCYRILFEARRGKYEDGLAFIFFWWFLSLVFVVFDRLKIVDPVIFGYSTNLFFGGIILLTATIAMVYYCRAIIMAKVRSIKR